MCMTQSLTHTVSKTILCNTCCKQVVWSQHRHSIFQENRTVLKTLFSVFSLINELSNLPTCGTSLALKENVLKPLAKMLCVRMELWDEHKIYFIQGFLSFLQNKKSPTLLSSGSHFLFKLHIFALGLYSYEQQSEEEAHSFQHLKRKTELSK